MDLRNEGMECYRGWANETRRVHEAGNSDPIWLRVHNFVMIIVFIMQSGVEASQGNTSVALRGATDEKLSSREVNIYRRAPRPNLLGSTDAEVNTLEFMATEKTSRERATRRFLENKRAAE